MNTNKFFSILLLVTFITGFTSCSKDDDDDKAGSAELLIGTWTLTTIDVWNIIDGKATDRMSVDFDEAESLTFRADGKVSSNSDGIIMQSSYVYSKEQLFIGAESFGVIELSLRKLVLERRLDIEEENDYGVKTGKIVTLVNQLTYIKN